jgi:hypothetical protein
MNPNSDRQWWPFAMSVDPEMQSPENAATLQFLSKALHAGSRSYLQHSDTEMGAIADNGRECLIVKRGKQRAEVILVERGETRHRHVYSYAEECEALRKASATALQWLADGVIEGA